MAGEVANASGAWTAVARRQLDARLKLEHADSLAMEAHEIGTSKHQSWTVCSARPPEDECGALQFGGCLE
jgi:hypothetical protein